MLMKKNTRRRRANAQHRKAEVIPKAPASPIQKKPITTYLRIRKSATNVLRYTIYKVPD